MAYCLRSEDDVPGYVGFKGVLGSGSRAETQPLVLEPNPKISMSARVDESSSSPYRTEVTIPFVPGTVSRFKLLASSLDKIISSCA